LWEAFLDPSDSYFLFAEERGYHFLLAFEIVPIVCYFTFERGPIHMNFSMTGLEKGDLFIQVTA
jgi:hypothetical protein